MRTDRDIIIRTDEKLLHLTSLPYTVQRTSGFDTVSVKHNTSQGYGQDGATLLGSSVNTRSLRIEGQIYATTNESMEALRLQLLNMFKPKTDILITQEFGGVKKTIIARASKTPKIDFSEVSVIQNYSVELVAMTPYWEDYETNIVEIADVAGGLHFPLQTPTCFGIKRASMIAVVTNESTDEIGMVIRFIAHGIVSNPGLLNIYTQEYIKVNCIMADGEVITVTTGDKKTVVQRINGADNNYIGHIDLIGGGYTFLTLAPGDNTFRMMADVGESMLETQIIYKNRYAGV